VRLCSPWNNHGYDVAKHFARKLTHVSPCWYQLKLRATTKPATKAGSKGKLSIRVELTGGHDADKQWIADVQEAGADHDKQVRTGVVPRFIVEPDSAALYVKLAGKEALQRLVIKTLSDEIKKINADGMVLEMSDAWAYVSNSPEGRKDPKLRNGLNLFVMRLGEAMHHSFKKEQPDDAATESAAAVTVAKQLFLVVRPFRTGSADFQNFDFEQTWRHVDGFSLMVRAAGARAGAYPQQTSLVVRTHKGFC